MGWVSQKSIWTLPRVGIVGNKRLGYASTSRPICNGSSIRVLICRYGQQRGGNLHNQSNSRRGRGNHPSFFLLVAAAVLFLVGVGRRFDVFLNRDFHLTALISSVVSRLRFKVSTQRVGKSNLRLFCRLQFFRFEFDNNRLSRFDGAQRFHHFTVFGGCCDTAFFVYSQRRFCFSD